MSLTSDLDEFFADGKEVVVKEPLRFKAKLGIGEKAYGLLRAREHLTTFTEALGVGTAASAAASSTVVATTFFAQSGFMASVLSTVGLGAAAVTPVGWVLAAGVLSGATYVGISRLLEKPKDSQLVVIPKYINTPLDIIAVSLIEMMLPVSMKIAMADGEIARQEWDAVHGFFVEEWGFSPGFVARLMEEYGSQIDSVSYAKLADSLNEYCLHSKDCDQNTIVSNFMSHLREVVEADGVITEEEKRQLDYLSGMLVKPVTAPSIGTFVDTASEKITRGARSSSEMAKAIAAESAKVLSAGLDRSPELAAKAKQAAAIGLVTGTKFGTEAARTATVFGKTIFNKARSKIGKNTDTE